MGTPAPEHQRNLNPTPEATAAMRLYGGDYARFGGGSMDFWDYLESRCPSRAALCKRLVTDVLEAAEAHGRISIDPLAREASA